MHKSQLELLLNQIYDCSIAINNAINTEDEAELSDLVARKAKKIKLLEKNKKFLEDSQMTLFDVMLRKIQEQELENINLLKAKRNIFYKKYIQSVKKSKILNKYSPIIESGVIVDTVE